MFKVGLYQLFKPSDTHICYCRELTPKTKTKSTQKIHCFQRQQMHLDLNFWQAGAQTDYYNYNYNRFTALWILSGTTQVSWYQKSKTNLFFNT